MKLSYFDNNATTQPSLEVIVAVTQALSEDWANPSAGYPLARQAVQLLNKARASVAMLVGASPSEIVFTSGGTESITSAILGVTSARAGRHVVTTYTEHAAILQCLSRLEAAGFHCPRKPESPHHRGGSHHLRRGASDCSFLVSLARPCRLADKRGVCFLGLDNESAEKKPLNVTTPFEKFGNHFDYKKRVVLPVVHVENLNQAMRNVEIAAVAGADGVFLINHRITWDKLLKITEESLKRFPNLWTGINTLDSRPVHVAPYFPTGLKGFWSDSTGVREDEDSQPEAEETRAALGHGDILYFGGVAFKYRPQPLNLVHATQRAAAYVDVITTSGEGTGISAHPRKISTMRMAAPRNPLAIASGITPENVHLFPGANAFLVATGISDNDSELNANRCRMLVEKVAALNQTTGR